MPNLGRSSTTTRNKQNTNKNPRGKNNSHTSFEIAKTARPELARDDLREAFAGKENAAKNLAHNNNGAKKSWGAHSTNVKSRVTAKSKERTPAR